MTLQLKIGHTYRNREGEKVRIVGMRTGTGNRYEGSDGAWYAENGRFDLDEPEHGFDLVEECEPDATEEPKPEALPLYEAIVSELAEMKIPGAKTVQGNWHNAALDTANEIIRKHFAALSVEEIDRSIRSVPALDFLFGDDAANAVMRLLRKE